MAGHIKPRGPNKWLLVVDLGKGPGGKRLTKSKIFNGGIRAAEKEHARLQVLYADSAVVDAEKTTLGALFDLWLEKYAKRNLSQSACELYESYIRVHLKPALGHIVLARVRPLQIEDYYQAALMDGCKRGGGLALRTVQSHHRLLRQVFRWGLRLELVQRSPMELVALPQLPKEKRTPRRRNVLSAEQLAQVVEEIRGTFLFLPVILSVTTGLRRGEVLGLRWQDVDLKSGRFNVTQALIQTRKTVQFGPPKTDDSARAIHLPDGLLPYLRQCRAEQADRRLALGPLYEENDLICCWEDGRWIRPDSASRAFRIAMQRLGLEHITFHGLRKTHSSLLAAAGEHPKVVSARLGHTKVDITMDLYTEISPEQDRAAANRMNGRLRSLLRGHPEVPESSASPPTSA